MTLTAEQLEALEDNQSIEAMEMRDQAIPELLKMARLALKYEAALNKIADFAEEYGSVTIASDECHIALEALGLIEDDEAVKGSEPR